MIKKKNQMLTNNTEEPQNQEQAHQGGGTGPVVVVCDVTDPAKLAHEQARAQAQWLRHSGLCRSR